APVRKSRDSFGYDCTLRSVNSIKNALSYDCEGSSSDSDSGYSVCKSVPERMNLLGSFEESALKGRIQPFSVIDGFTADLGASGSFCPPHVRLAVATFYFSPYDDSPPLPYYGHCNLEQLGKRRYHIPARGNVQVTVFNPQGSVVKMFIVQYNLSDMPPYCQTFVRQRTYFMPYKATLDDVIAHRSWLRYLIHLRFCSSRSRKIYLHSDIRMLFSRKSELDAFNLNSVGGQNVEFGQQDSESYDLRSFTEMPENPRYSPRKLFFCGPEDK
ncbi:unnamed protein product, partial [Soboliphyme baturini]|uniref:DUF4210 domain-containing protein n=1 Tax=Soboliphyme baturini TaxID=241478 RepID=A0A183IBZ7_9BILA